ncbi:ribonuclease J [Dehalococcoidia bacterium]|nr:ribonuclease J [Dehalococcoidia bacterium]
MKTSPVRVIPLGGLGEIGRNMLALEYDDDILVIDAGVLFPGEDMPGVDFVIPDISYLIENESKVRAILITHGHEDHIGALPWVLQKLSVPVYAPRLAHGLITVKLREHGGLKEARLNVVEPQMPFKIGAFRIQFFRVCHSIPDAMGIAIETPIGMVVHTGDFKIDHAPVDGKRMDFAYLAQIAKDGILLLCSDSTYAEMEGYTVSEKVVGQALDHAIGAAEGRVMVATFASLISRMQQVINAAVKHNRKVTVVGRSMLNNFKMATNMGYLKVPSGVVVSMNEARKLPQKETLILATGAQGEPTSALVRIANGEHRSVEIDFGDTVIISASPIPGNEALISKTIDNLYRQGAKVLYSKIAMVHVHGHGSSEELKMMLSLMRPKYFLPVHGEYRHLVAHAELARTTGVLEENVFVIEDGDVLEITKDYGEVVGRVPAGPAFVDGRQMLGREGTVLKERSELGHHGVVVIMATIDKRASALVGLPVMTSYGVVELDELEDLREKTSYKAQTTLEHCLNKGLEYGHIKDQVDEEMSDFLHEEMRRRPIVLTHLDFV